MTDRQLFVLCIVAPIWLACGLTAYLIDRERQPSLFRALREGPVGLVAILWRDRK